jgi:hypothetical protein
MGKEMVVAYLGLLLPYFSGEAEENTKIPQPGLSVSGPRTEAGISGTQIMQHEATHSEQNDFKVYCVKLESCLDVNLYYKYSKLFFRQHKCLF